MPSPAQRPRRLSVDPFVKPLTGRQRAPVNEHVTRAEATRCQIGKVLYGGADAALFGEMLGRAGAI